MVKTSPLDSESPRYQHSCNPDEDAAYEDDSIELDEFYAIRECPQQGFYEGTETPIQSQCGVSLSIS